MGVFHSNVTYFYLSCFCGTTFYWSWKTTSGSEKLNLLTGLLISLTIIQKICLKLKIFLIVMRIWKNIKTISLDCFKDVKIKKKLRWSQLDGSPKTARVLHYRFFNSQSNCFPKLEAICQVYSKYCINDISLKGCSCIFYINSCFFSILFAGSV